MSVQAPAMAQMPSQTRLRWPRMLRSPQGIAGLVALLVVLGIAFIGPLVAPHPLDQPIGPPGVGPGQGTAFGTDFLGRDVLSRVLHGGTYVLELAAVTVVLTYLIGVSIGMVAGLSRSLADPVLMRAVDIFITFPPLLLLLVLISGAGHGFAVLVIGIVLVLFPGVARIVRTSTLEIANTGYVEAALSRGETVLALMRREVLPNIAPAILADLGVRFSGAIILAASVNFLGLGEQPPAANWGLMIAENREIISANLWSVLLPAAMLGLLTISVNLLGDAYSRSTGRSEAGR
jgi:ABC-type dipeptide/oligopeptide/nickel transport system permease subunit